jgi:tRNA threonylcarbamoyladenosine biosynthesis protein TsaE
VSHIFWRAGRGTGSKNRFTFQVLLLLKIDADRVPAAHAKITRQGSSRALSGSPQKRMLAKAQSLAGRFDAPCELSDFERDSRSAPKGLGEAETGRCRRLGECGKLHRPMPIRELPDLSATQAFAAEIGGLLRPGDTVLLEGPLGAGKTEFARALLRHLSGDPALEVPSPSYTLVQGYETRLGPVYHFDLWRLDGPAALAELGWEEARAGIVLVEWPERLGALRPTAALTIALSPTGPDSRRAVLSGWAERIAGLISGA